MLNTLFFVVIQSVPAYKPAPVVQQTIQSVQHHHSSNGKSGIKAKAQIFSKSLLRLILENCLYASKADSMPGSEVDDEVKKVEYIYQDSYCLFIIALKDEPLAFSHSSFSIPNSYLDTLTPPPKGVA